MPDIKQPPPPPPSSPKKPGAQQLSTLPPRQRLSWIQSREGLYLSSLKLHYYPDAALIEKSGLPISKVGDAIPENETEIKEKLESLTRADIESLLQELFQLDDAIALPFMKKLEAKIKNWKTSPYGLNDCHKFLLQSAQEWRLAAKKARLMDINPNDPFYAVFHEKRASADVLLQQYNELLEQYLALPEGEAKTTIFSKLQVNIAELKKQKETIKPLTHQLEELRKALAKAEGQRLDRIKGIENKITALKLENQALQSAFDPTGEFSDIVAKNDKSLEELAQQLAHPSPIVFAQEQQAIDKARAAFQHMLEENDKIQLLQSFFKPPESWLEISKKKVKLPSETKKSTFDSTGMVILSPRQEERAFDIQFLPIVAINNLARFFASDYQRHLAYMQDKNGLIELMNRINALTRMSEKINFNYLMDIAQGKITRPHNTYPPDNPQKFFEKIEEHPEIQPDYTALLARSNRHFNIRDPDPAASAESERAFDKRHFQQYCQERGITFEPPANKRKYYLYHRKIDLDYLNFDQIQRLSRFFEKFPGEFLTKDSQPDKDRIVKYVNDLFDSTGLSFEEVIDIAAGHLLRADGKVANKDSRYALAFDVKRSEPSPDYDAFIKQREDYLAEQKRIEQSALIEPTPVESLQDEKETAPAAPSPSVFTPAKTPPFPRLSPHRAMAAQAKKVVPRGDLTGLGLRNHIVEMLMMENATKDAISFLAAPERMDMNHLLNHAPRKRGWLPVMEYSSAAVHRDLSALQELCIQLNQSESRVENTESKLHVLTFLESVNERAEKDRYYKLMILKGYLLRLEERYGGPVNGVYYKMGALCKQLLVMIDEACAIGVYNISDVLKDLLDDDICTAEYDHFKSQYDLAKARDEKAIKERSSRPKRSP